MPNKRELDYFAAAAEVGKTDVGAQVFRHMDVLNDKASAMLTHISIMIAAASIFLASQLERRGDGVITLADLVMVVEFAAYVMLAAFCTRCIYATALSDITSHAGGSTADKYVEIYASRRNAYRTVYFVNIVLAALFLVALALKVFLPALSLEDVLRHLIP